MSYAEPASKERQEAAAAALAANGYDVIMAKDGDEARAKALALIPEGADVMTMSSVTCTEIGLYKELDESGKYDSVRTRLLSMDRTTQNREMQRMGAAPEWSVGSVHAITEDGHLLIASQSGSQLPAHAAGADRVLFVAGAQKIVKDVPEGIKRIWEHSLPLEHERFMKARGKGSAVNEILVMYAVPGFAKGRVTLILIDQAIGF